METFCMLKCLWLIGKYFLIFSGNKPETSASLVLEEFTQFDSGLSHTQTHTPLVTMETSEHILTYPWESILPIIKQTQLYCSFFLLFKAASWVTTILQNKFLMTIYPIINDLNILFFFYCKCHFTKFPGLRVKE